jgi:hypothetical protein
MSVYGSSSYPEYVQLVNQKAVHTISEAYMNLITNLARSAGMQTRVTNKLPLNFRFLGLLYLLFPKAKFIHCMRHPLDTCLSIYFQWFGKGHDYAYDLSEIGFCYKEYQRLMAHWSAVLPVEIFEINYEELVRNQEELSRELIRFCGLDWDKRCLKFHKTERPVFTLSNWQVRQSIYRSSVNRRENYAQFLGPLKAILEGE